MIEVLVLVIIVSVAIAHISRGDGSFAEARSFGRVWRGRPPRRRDCLIICSFIQGRRRGSRNGRGRILLLEDDLDYCRIAILLNVAHLVRALIAAREALLGESVDHLLEADVNGAGSAVTLFNDGTDLAVQVAGVIYKNGDEGFCRARWNIDNVIHGQNHGILNGVYCSRRRGSCRGRRWRRICSRREPRWPLRR